MTRKVAVFHSVVPWWRDRLDAGRPVSIELIESYDFKGQGPWYTRIAIVVLYKDYLLYNGPPAPQDRPTISEFGVAFRRVCPVLTKAKRRGTLELTPGRVVRENRTFLDIPDLETCKDFFRQQMIDYIWKDKQ